VYADVMNITVPWYCTVCLLLWTCK